MKGSNFTLGLPEESMVGDYFPRIVVNRPPLATHFRAPQAYQMVTRLDADLRMGEPSGIENAA